MISNSDFEKAWFLYKTEYEPQNISINDFCFRKGLTYKEFNKWYGGRTSDKAVDRPTKKRIVLLQSEGREELWDIQYFYINLFAEVSQLPWLLRGLCQSMESGS